MFASPIPINFATSGGAVAGTAITFTLSEVGGTVRVDPSAGESNADTWSWSAGGYSELVAVAGESLTVNFSSPIPVDLIVFGAESVSNYAPTNLTTLTLSGGNATTADFTVTDGLSVLTGPTGLASYNPATGVITPTSNDQSLIVGSTSTDTITSLTLSASGNDGDGYAIFFGTVAAPGPGSWVTWARFAKTCPSNQV